MDAIPPDIAKTHLNRNFANLVKRGQPGGKISRAERAMLQSMAVGAGGALGRGIVPFAPAAGGGSTDEFSDLEFDRYDEFNMLSRQLTEVADDLGQVTGGLDRLIESFRNDEQRFAANSRVMQEDITSLTSQPIDGLFRRLDRIFRDAIQAENKEAALRFESTGTLLDRSIIERLYTPPFTSSATLSRTESKRRTTARRPANRGPAS